MSAFVRLRTILTLALVAATGALAGPIWDGGGGGNSNIDAPANWGGSAPLFDGTADVVFGTGGSTATINVNASFRRLFFNREGAFNLAAGAGTLTLGAGGLAAQIPTTTARTYTIAENLTLAADQVWGITNNTGGTTLTVSGAISDGAASYGLAISGSGTVILSGNNSYDGPTSVTNGTLQVKHSNAMGSTASPTTVYDSGQIYITDGINTSEPLFVSGTSRAVLCNSGSNTLNGLVTIVKEIRVSCGGGSSVYLVFANGITNNAGGSYTIMNPGGANVCIVNKPMYIGNGYFYSDQTGTIVFGVSGNTIGGAGFDRPTIRTDAVNVFPPTVEIGFGYTASLNMNGNNQTFRLKNNVNGTPTTITSATPATFTHHHTANVTFLGRFLNAVTLVKDGSGTLSISNASENVCMVVSNGTLELLTQTCIADSGRVEIANGGGAKLKINALLNETVDTLFFGTTQQSAGTYGASGSGADTIDNVHFSGTGKVTVQSSAPVVVTGATWDAGGGGDTSIATAVNWVGDPPTLDLTAGTTYASFGTGGTLATLNQNVSLNGLLFNRAANFTLTNTVAESLTLGTGGIGAAIPDANSRTYTIATPVTLAANQNWGVTNNGAGVATLAIPGNIDDGILSFGIVKSGSGPLVLSGSNSYDGVTLVKTGGIVRISSPWALGSTNGMTRVENGAWMEVSGGITVAEPIEINGDAASFYSGALRATGGTNTLLGAITVPVNGSRIGATGSDTFLDIAGGLYIYGGMAMQNVAPVRYINKPIKADPWWTGIYFHGSGITMIAVTNNDFGAADIANGTLRMGATNALTTRTRISISPNGTFDLDGCSQIVGELHSGAPANATTHTLTSSVPATLTITATDNDRVYAGRITGAVGLIKNGIKTLIISNAVNSTSGDMVVNAGKLIVAAPSSTLGVGTNITVTGGTLELQTSVAIADNATLNIADGGTAKVSVAAGQTETVGWLFLGGKMQAPGLYGAFNDTTHFAGSGAVNVLHGLGGTLLLIR